MVNRKHVMAQLLFESNVFAFISSFLKLLSTNLEKPPKMSDLD